MLTCNTGNVWQRAFVFMFGFFVAVMYTYKDGHLATRLCVYVCAVVEGMYTCETGNFENESLWVGYAQELDLDQLLELYLVLMNGLN